MGEKVMSQPTEGDQRRLVVWGDGKPLAQVGSRLHKVRELSAGGTHYCALTDKGVFSWGRGKVGQLGQGRELLQLAKPKQVSIPLEEGTIISSIKCGPIQSAAITSK